MHSPETVAFEIYLGRKKKRNGHYRTPLITIWHNDPETDNTDDSCGWFMRERHGDPEMLNKIKKALDFDFDRVFKSDESGTTYYVGYFSPSSGMPNFSTQGIVLDMFGKAAWEFFKYNRKKHRRWMQNNLYSILHFAENTTDSLRDSVAGTFRIGTGEEWKREEALNYYSSIIYGWLLRENRKWYQHPRWHIHHWSIQFHPWQDLKRRYWNKCCICGKRGSKSPFMTDWNGTKRWHQKCDQSTKAMQPPNPL